MSFSYQIKEEIIFDLKNNYEKLYFLYYYLIFKSNILKEDEEILKISIKYEKIADILKDILYKNYELDSYFELAKKSLTIYSNFLKLKKEVNKIYDDLKQDNFIKDIFLKSLFVSKGSINDPLNNQYHLEFSFQVFEDALLSQKILIDGQIEAKLTKRENRYVVYLKNSEQISDFLKLIKTDKALFYFENIKLERELTSNVKRKINIELANSKKQAQNSTFQVYMIEKIIKNYGYNNLDIKLQEVIDLRLEYKMESLNELVNLYIEKYKKNISKSGLNHRFIKLKEIYQSLK